MNVTATFAQSPGPWRFNELRDVLDISQNTLSARLDDLIEEDLIIRRSYDEIPPRVEYEATEKLKDFKPVVRHLSAWVERHDE